jgi:hypothetical protein
MRPSFRTFLYLTPLALAAALYLLARADRARLDHGPLTESWPLAAFEPSFEEGVLRADRRSEAKQQVTDALIEGRLTLRQAAARFRDIDADLPPTGQPPRPPGYSEEEWSCRQVITYVEGEFVVNRRAPALAQEWVARLEAELREQLRHAGAPRPHPDRETAGEPER